MANAAAEYYHKLLDASPSAMEESRDFLRERMRSAGLIFGDRVLSPYLRPHLILESEWRRVTSTCEALWPAFQKVGQAALGSPSLCEELGLTESERTLLAIDPGYPEISVSSRLDSFLTEESYQFVELNAECPAGIGFADLASEIFMELPAMRQVMGAFEIEPLMSRDRMLASLLDAYREFGGRNKPVIAIVDWKDVPTRMEFEIFQDYFRRQGYECLIVDPRELEFRGGMLYAGEARIDLVYRRLLTNEFLARISETRALLDACRAGAVCVVNSFRSKVIHKKMLFGILTDERFSRLFTPEELDVIRRHIPWTRRVRQGKTVRDNAVIDLVPFIRVGREELVLKPNDEYGGKGIFIGSECSDSEWDSAIETALQGDYLVQQRVRVLYEQFPYFDPDGRIEITQQLVDLDPLLYSGKVRGAFTRLSTSALCNVTSGGGMVPAFVVKGR